MAFPLRPALGSVSFWIHSQSGPLAELVDVLDSKSSVLTGVRVRFSEGPPLKLKKEPGFGFLF